MANKSLGTSAASGVVTTTATPTNIIEGSGGTSNQAHFQVECSTSGVTIWYSATSAAPYSLFDSTNPVIPMAHARELAEQIFRFVGTSTYSHWRISADATGTTITYSKTANGTFVAYGTKLPWTLLQRGLAEEIWQICGS